MIRYSPTPPHPRQKRNDAGNHGKLSSALLTALLLLPTTLFAASGPATDKAAVQDICDDSGGNYEAQGEVNLCTWGNRTELHFIKFDRGTCLDGCNADGPMVGGARFNNLKITDPVTRAQAQQQQILFVEKILRRRAMAQKKN